MIHALPSPLSCLIIFPLHLSPSDILSYLFIVRPPQLTCELHVGRVSFSFVHCVLPGLKIVDGTEQVFSEYVSKERMNE